MVLVTVLWQMASVQKEVQLLPRHSISAIHYTG